jgi:hypothetical protein
MTKLNLSEQTPQPTSELDRREAELAQQHQALADDASERRRLDGANVQAAAAYQQARDLHSRILNDPDTNIDATTDSDRAEAAKSHKSARDAAAEASAAFTAHEAATGDLDARARALSSRARVLEQTRVEAAHKAIVKRKVRAALELEAIELEEHRLVQGAYAKWPDGLGLVPCTFPVGVFSAAETSIGDAKRSVFRDDVVRTVGVVYPELLSDLLPAEEATAVLAAIEQQRARGVIYFAGRAIHWTMAGGWHTGGIAVGELKNFLRGAIRRQHHGI